MLESLKNTFRRLVAAQQTQTFRYLYDVFSLEDRLTGLIGPRGVGKTTLLIQVIKKQFPELKGVFYFSADHIYFNTNSLYQFVEGLYDNEDIHTFFIDEIHKYPNWDQEIKNLYDSFPKISIVFSGSSSLDLVKGSYDLSRRARLYTLQGMSFREYLNFKTDSRYQPIDFKQLLENPLDYNHYLQAISKIKVHFKEYLYKGYYPFFVEGESTYYEKILRLVEKTIYEDIAGFYKLKTQNLIYFKKILNYFSTIEPGSFNHHKLAKNLGVDDKTVAHYMNILESTGLIRSAYAYPKGKALLKSPEKIFLNNTTLVGATNAALGENQPIGTIRELFFLQTIQNIDMPIFCAEQGDYRTKDYGFEIGGKNKTTKQIKNAALKTYLVKDDIFSATKREIPLYLFGFIY